MHVEIAVSVVRLLDELLEFSLCDDKSPGF
jgi:hypothetical protein